MQTKAIRGATTADQNSKGSILSATKELLSEIFSQNQIVQEDICSIIFSLTDDLNAEFPAVAARDLGFNDTPLFCCQEINVPSALAKCIRVLVTINTEKTQKELKHIYLKEAINLRR